MSKGSDSHFTKRLQPGGRLDVTFVKDIVQFIK